MKVRQVAFRSLVVVLAASMSGSGQAASERGAATPDFSGIWTHPYWPGFDPALSGQGGIVNKARRPDGVGDSDQLVGDYTSPILKPRAADVVRQLGEISKSGVTFPTPANQCWPQPVPYIVWTIGIQLLQQKDKITILYSNPDHEMRQVRMNATNPKLVTPSLYGDSVGHYEGETLVIDTVGVRTARPFAMVDVYGTPYSEALHVVERYRLVDDNAAKQAEQRTLKENISIPFNDSGLSVDTGYKGKALQLEFTVEDEGVFTRPWSASMTYRRASGAWPEFVCSENTHEYYAGKESQVPRAETPDF